MGAEKWSYDASASLYDILLELWALEEYISILEVELPRVVEKEKRRIRQDLKAEDEQQLYYADIAEYQLDEGITTRLITGSALVATWATFESAVQRAAGILGQPRDSILNKSKKLFERLGIQHPVQINDLYALRNALAHANGRLDDISLDNTDDRLRKRIEIERLANSSPGLKTSHDGYLIVSIEFVVRTFKFIEPLLLELAEQTDRERVSKQSG